MMKLSEKLRQRRHDDITMLHHSNIGMELIQDAEQLESQNAALLEALGTLVDHVTGDVEEACGKECGFILDAQEAIREASK